MQLFAVPPLLVMAVAAYVSLEHLGLFVMRRRTRTHLSFALTILSTAAYCAFSALRYDAASPEASMNWVRAQAITTALFCPLLLFFIHDVVGRQDRPVLVGSAIFFGSMAIVGAFTDWLVSDSRIFARTLPLVGVTYYDMRPGVLMQVLFGCLITVLAYSFLLILQHYRSRDRSVRPILISAALYFLTILSDITVNMGLLHLPYLSEFGILFLIVGMDRSLHNDFAEVARGLVESERRYRSLVEDTTDIVFLLDPDGTIESINQAVSPVLGFRAEELEGRPLGELLHQPVGTPESLTLLHFQEQLEGLRGPHRRVEFKSELVNRRREPVELSIRLERIERGSSYRIHGKASLAAEDVLGRFCRDEEQHYEIPNNLAITELLIRRLTDGLTKLTSADEVTEVRIGLQEILINAVEHGNLEISFEEKAAAMEAGRLSELVRQRRDDPRLQDRRVRVYYRLNPNEVCYTISDDGNGFDHRKMLQRDIKARSEARRMHGRGLALALSMFDEVSFNEAGNSVTLRRRLAPAPAAGMGAG